MDAASFRAVVMISASVGVVSLHSIADGSEGSVAEIEELWSSLLSIVGAETDTENRRFLNENVSRRDSHIDG